MATQNRLVISSKVVESRSAMPLVKDPNSSATPKYEIDHRLIGYGNGIELIIAYVRQSAKSEQAMLALKLLSANPIEEIFELLR